MDELGLSRIAENHFMPGEEIKQFMKAIVHTILSFIQYMPLRPPHK